jgi:glucose-1-phosphate thymidylyltransferase
MTKNMKIVLYENNSVDQLYPITLTRPSFDIFCGALTLYDLIRKQFSDQPVDLIVRKLLQKIVAAKYPPTPADGSPILYLDGSLIPSFSAIQKLKEILKDKGNVIIKNRNRIIGAYILPESENAAIQGQNNTEAFIQGLNLPIVQIDWPTFDFFWETIVYNQRILKENLDYLKNNYRQIQPNVFAGANVAIAPNTAFDTAEGIIIIDEGTKILPFATFSGPAYIGPHCLIKEFGIIRENCCFGPVCKIGGEIEATIIQGYSNKQHYGFLGHSYLGEWINIAAGTSNSDLKNTYSLVKIGGTDTGQQFLGTVIGDFSRTAINTAIFTGRTVGACSFIYGTITKDIIPFTNYAAHLGCVIELDLAVAIKAQKAMFARRGREQTEADRQLLESVYGLTAADRKTAGIKPGKLEFKI